MENSASGQERSARKKLSKNALKRRFNSLQLRRNNRLLELQEQNKNSCTNKQTSHVNHQTDDASELSESLSSHESSNAGRRHRKPNSTDDLSFSNLSEQSSNSDLSSKHEIYSTYSPEKLFRLSNEFNDLSNDDFIKINDRFRDICIFCEFIQLKIKQLNNKHAVINSFDNIEPVIHTLYRFLRKCEHNFKHFKYHLIKSYVELCQNFMRRTAGVLNNCEISQSNERIEGESENQMNAIASHSDENKINAQLNHVIRDVSVLVERGEIKFPQYFQKIDTKVKSDENHDSDREINNLVNLNSLKRSLVHNADDKCDDTSKKSKLDEEIKQNVSDGEMQSDASEANEQNDEELSKPSLSDASEEKMELNYVPVPPPPPDMNINDIVSKEILELSDNSFYSPESADSGDDIKVDIKSIKEDEIFAFETNVKNEGEKENKNANGCTVTSYNLDDLFSSSDSSECEIIDDKSEDVCYVNSSDSEEEKGRKNIRSIIEEVNLEQETQKAIIDERKRLERLALRDENLNLNVIERYFVLDRDPKTKKKLVFVDPILNKLLKDHQRNGIKFMWDSCYESLEMLNDENNQGNGCILAHCMGLGKTLQVIALCHTIMQNRNCKTKSVLVVCPRSVALNWKDEIQKWLFRFPKAEKKTFDFNGVSNINHRCIILKRWHSGGGFMVISYDMYRNMMKVLQKADYDINPRLHYIKDTLRDPGPDIVFLDEGHELRNEKTIVRKQLEEIRTRRRVILTGTPMQNNLREYYWMVQFVKPKLLGSYKEFTNRFANPIRNGQHKNSNHTDIKLMKKRSHVLHKLLKGTVQRKEVAVLREYLPRKYEYVLFLYPSSIQEKLYNNFLQFFGQKMDASTPMVAAKFFADFQALKRIWTHPYALVDFLKKNLRLKEKENENVLMDVDEIIDDAYSQGIHKVIKQLKEPLLPWDWWKNIATKDDLNCIDSSNKLSVMFDIIQESQLMGDKVLVFTSSINVLNTIEHFLKKITEVTESNNSQMRHPIVGKYRGIWKSGADYFRFDGNLPVINRRKYCNTFNDPNNKQGRLFLVSTRAGGIGLNMVGANRVIILDVSWNPAVDTQSIFRTYRLQQKKICYVYRLISVGFMEQKIYERSVTKEALSCRVVDEQQIGRHYTTSDLSELYALYCKPEPHIYSINPEDTLLARILSTSTSIIQSYHEHDSLLTDIEEEKLPPEECETAWQEFLLEREKSIVNQYPVSNNQEPMQLDLIQKMPYYQPSPPLPINIPSTSYGLHANETVKQDKANVSNQPGSSRDSGLQGPGLIIVNQPGCSRDNEKQSNEIEDLEKPGSSRDNGLHANELLRQQLRKINQTVFPNGRLINDLNQSGSSHDNAGQQTAMREPIVDLTKQIDSVEPKTIVQLRQQAVDFNQPNCSRDNELQTNPNPILQKDSFLLLCPTVTDQPGCSKEQSRQPIVDPGPGCSNEQTSQQPELSGTEISDGDDSDETIMLPLNQDGYIKINSPIELNSSLEDDDCFIVKANLFD